MTKVVKKFLPQALCTKWSMTIVQGPYHLLHALQPSVCNEMSFSGQWKVLMQSDIEPVIKQHDISKSGWFLKRSEFGCVSNLMIDRNEANYIKLNVWTVHLIAMNCKINPIIIIYLSCVCI